ncbi:MAG: glycosyltransferase [Chitinophagaceae bacterium]|nr:MAG: glycosyltransferase [Chitinophagaceae bacterium]
MGFVTKVNVLYLTYDGLTDPLGQSQVLPYLAGLSKLGYSFTVLSFEKKERFQKEGDQIRKIAGEAGINWVPLSFTAKPPVLSKIYDRNRMWRTALSLHKKQGFSLIHCRSYVSAEVGLRMKKKFGVKMLFDMRGFWADEKIDSGQWKLSNPLYKQIYLHYKKKEKEFLLQSDGIVSLTQAAKTYLLQQPAYRHLSIDVIPCCADLEHFNYERVGEEEKAAVRASLHIPTEAKVISYVGSFGGWYMAEEMFTFVKLLQAQRPEYCFLFLTKDDPALVKLEAEKVGIDTARMSVLYINRKQLPSYISISTCSLFFIRNTFSKTASSPTKHAELMGMGVPVICNTIGDTGNIISETKTGMLVDQFEERTLQAAIDALPQIEAISKAHIRSCGKQLFDLKEGVQKYFKIYQAILG